MLAASSSVDELDAGGALADDFLCLGLFRLRDEADAGGALADDSFCLGLFRLVDKADA